MVEKLIAGGQTGADRAALDFARHHGVPHGGWCPRGRWAEDGNIPSDYELTETPTADPAQRTDWNVRDSDATVIFSIGEVLTGGSKQTADCAARYGRPWLHLSATKDASRAAQKLTAFLDDFHVKILNVAGPRASEEPAVGQFVLEVLEEAFCSPSGSRRS